MNVGATMPGVFKVYAFFFAYRPTCMQLSFNSLLSDSTRPQMILGHVHLRKANSIFIKQIKSEQVIK